MLFDKKALYWIMEQKYKYFFFLNKYLYKCMFLLICPDRLHAIVYSMSIVVQVTNDSFKSYFKWNKAQTLQPISQVNNCFELSI